MKLKKKSKAFTLTELLVVVVVIGVLSAVVLPKYSKVIETRRTTEAEELMGAIRTEQEKRCALDKEYLMKFDGLKDIVKNPDTKNYKLALASTGINATRNDKYSYTLEMPSYADGRICCSGADCDKLNKNYPACDELTNKSKTPDYQDSPASCAGKEPEPPTPPSPCEVDPTSCECNPNQAKCCPEGTTWNGSACVTPEPEPEPDPCNDCSCPEYAASHQTECNPKPGCTNGEVRGQDVCNSCGTRTTEKCVNGKWISFEGKCSKTEQECCTGTWDYSISKCVDCNGKDKWSSYACCSSLKYKWIADKSKCCMPYPPTSGWVEERDNGCWKQECTEGQESQPILQWSTGGATLGTVSGFEADWDADRWCKNTLTKCESLYQKEGMTCYSKGAKCYYAANKNGYQPGSANSSAYANFTCSLLECKQTGTTEPTDPVCTWKSLF